VHSYYVECNNTADILCTTNYGVEFVSGFQHNNIFGLQFHPEKSHKYGMELLANFCKI
jgi:glutamine amidotransferase